MTARLKEEYYQNIRSNLMKEMGYKSIMQVPKIQKIVLNIGIGDAHSNAKALEKSMSELAAITGQKAVPTRAKRSIAGFKLREGMIVGTKATLRGERMYEFLDRLMNFALPRVRDFKGLPAKAFDRQGNYNFSINEQIIFPEVDFDKVDTIHGMNITISTTASTPEEAFALLKAFKFPFRDQQKQAAKA